MGAQAANCKHTYNKFKCIEVVSIYDGDSIRVNIDKLHPLFGEDVPVRISNVDTAERYGRAPCEREMANLARNFIHHRISLAKNRKQIELRNPIRDKYFRINAELWVNGFSIGRALIKDVPEEYRIYAEKEFTYNGIRQYNRNGLLWDKSMNVDGIKTGHTSGAGYNLVSSATEGDMRLVAVVMGTKSESARKAESKKLLSYGFRFFETVAPHKAGEEVTSEPIWMADTDVISLGIEQDTFVTIPRGQAKNLKAEFVIDKQLEAPIAKGQVVGKLHYKLNDEQIAEYPVMALESVEQGSFFNRLWDYIVLFVKSLF